MWSYNSSTGELSHNDNPVGDGYSGHPPHVNDVSAESIPNTGPLPRGLWTFGTAIDSPKLGPMAIPVIPKPGTDTFGRSSFFMHGDEIDHVGEELASDGCMIFGHSVRLFINLSSDKDLEVL